MNLVTELDILKRALDAEATLRDQASAEFARGEQHGPMRIAHDQAVKDCLHAADVLLGAEGA